MIRETHSWNMPLKVNTLEYQLSFPDEQSIVSLSMAGLNQFGTGTAENKNRFFSFA